MRMGASTVPVRHRTVAAADGRIVSVLDVGAADGRAVVKHHGTPGAGRLYRSEIDSAQRLGVRLVAYDRPGYGGGAPPPRRPRAGAGGGGGGGGGGRGGAGGVGLERV